MPGVVRERDRARRRVREGRAPAAGGPRDRPALSDHRAPLRIRDDRQHAVADGVSVGLARRRVWRPASARAGVACGARIGGNGTAHAACGCWCRAGLRASVGLGRRRAAAAGDEKRQGEEDERRKAGAHDHGGDGSRWGKTRALAGSWKVRADPGVPSAPPRRGRHMELGTTALLQGSPSNVWA
jgi:hypothetical protein